MKKLLAALAFALLTCSPVHAQPPFSQFSLISPNGGTGGGASSGATIPGSLGQNLYSNGDGTAAATGLLYVDVPSNRIGIGGTTVPSATLHVTGNTVTTSWTYLNASTLRTTPTTPLEVSGTISSSMVLAGSNGSSVNPSINVGSAGAGYGLYQIAGVGTALASGGSEMFRCYSSDCRSGSNWSFGSNGALPSGVRLAVYGTSMLSGTSVVGTTGMTTPTAGVTLDVRGQARLLPLAADPGNCDGARKGTLAMTSTTAVLCSCNGTSYVNQAGGACSW